MKNKPSIRQVNLVLDADLATLFAAVKAFRHDKPTGDRCIAFAIIKWASSRLTPSEIAAIIPDRRTVHEANRDLEAKLAAASAELAALKQRTDDAAQKSA